MTSATPSGVDPYSVVPKYYQLRDILRQRIERGEWERDAAIPSERELEDLYQLSRTTIREALNLLEQEGLVYRSHGRGTFVATPRQLSALGAATSFTDDMRMRGMEPGQRILFIGVESPSLRVRAQLELDPSVDSVQVIRRVRTADGIPMGLQVIWLAQLGEARMTEQDLEETGSLYDLLAARFGLHVAEAEQTVVAAVATAEQAELLEVETGSPLLLIERRAFSQHRQPLEYSLTYHRGDRYQYYARLAR